MTVTRQGKNVSDMLIRYREAAEKTGNPVAKEANVWARRLHKHYKQLCTSEEGKAGIVALLSDPSPYVRCWAASHSLAWTPEIARHVLEELRDAKGPCSFTAEITLKEFEQGRLSFDY